MVIHNLTMSRGRTLVWLLIYTAVLVWSVVAPKDYMTWLLEVFPALAGLAALAWTWHKFPLTPLVYWLILVHCIILMVGGHYTYAQVPLFNWLKENVAFLVRNDFDRVGHFAQGFVPALIAREVLLRRSPLTRGGWLVFTVLSFCLALSAAYELLEWAVAEASGSQAVAFLATQGDVWDTQWDMLTALIGAIAGLMLLSRWHDRQLRAMNALD